ncbi:MAG: 2-dehydropantoate 2-reductase N-terminal domain-containing protein [Pseudomonadota bacterium]
MTLLIWGSGAIGGTIGAYLVRAGIDVHFVDTAVDHVAAINTDGLAIEGPIEAFTVPARASLPQDVSGTFDAVWLCTKAQHTSAATEAIMPHLAPDGHILSLQNGLTELIIADIAGRERTLGAFINFGADYLAPGRILYGGNGACVVGELDGTTTSRLTETRTLLCHFEPEAITTPTIFGYLWGKLGYGALLFATALTNDSIADVLANPSCRATLTALAMEMNAVAAAEGVTPLGFNGYDPALFRPSADPSPSFDAMVAHNAKSAKSHSGIWRDLAVRKRKTEADPILTKPVAIGAAHGIAMPLTCRLIALIEAIERGERALSADNLAALAEETP